jgi:transmembrane sensor
VELKGQAYFEVAKNTRMPFHVSVEALDVQVLGTSFNIMAYNNEDAIKTTLLEGSVMVKRETSNVKLRPGQQAVATRYSPLTTRSVDADATIAWKNGLFQLEGTSVAEVFRQIERWYDVDIIVQKDFANENLLGVFSRKQYVSELLKILEEAGVGQFKVEGRKIYVSK